MRAMILWQDQTSYSRDDKTREPRVWALKVRGLRISVSKHIHFEGGWVLDCQPWFDVYDLHTTDSEQARRKALELVRAELTNALDFVSLVMSTMAMT